MRRRHRKVEVALLARIAKAVRNEARIVRERNVCRRVLCFGSGVRVSVLICQCLSLGDGKFRWGVPVNRFEKGYPTLICRCTPNNRGIKDMYLMPRIDTPHTHEFRIKDSLSDRRIYDLRATFASRANVCHATGLTVAHLLGHASTQILPTYVRPFDENTRALIEAMDAARKNQRSPSGSIH